MLSISISCAAAAAVAATKASMVRRVSCDKCSLDKSQISIELLLLSFWYGTVSFGNTGWYYIGIPLQLHHPSYTFLTKNGISWSLFHSSNHRFRSEAREERLGSSADSPVQRAFNIASSSVIVASLLIVGLLAATVACLPMLLLLKITSIFFSCSSQEEDVDTSVRPYSPSTDFDVSSFTERLLISMMGNASLSCTSDGTSQYEEQCIAPLLSI